MHEESKTQSEWEKYFICCVITGLLTGMNTAGASIGQALLNQFESNTTVSNTTKIIELTPDDTTKMLKNAAISTVIGFMIIGMLYACFSAPSRKITRCGRLFEALQLFYPMSCANIVLAFALPIFTSFFFFRLPLRNSAQNGLATGIGANIITAPLLTAAGLFHLGKQYRPNNNEPISPAVEQPEPINIQTTSASDSHQTSTS